jgi:hypothetical protein
MQQSRGGFEVGPKRRWVLGNGPEHVNASSRQAEDGLTVPVAHTLLAIVKLEPLVATAGFVEETGYTSRRINGAMPAPDASACMERKQERLSASARSSAASGTPTPSRLELWRPLALLQPENRRAI